MVISTPFWWCGCANDDFCTLKQRHVKGLILFFDMFEKFNRPNEIESSFARKRSLRKVVEKKPGLVEL